ncbi:asparagine synthase (glutamine-hydrolyzing) [Alkalilimnicola ehrlichii MLHE-1]|uniref:asparagine synthase (glutamine-hydrolyzing) n=1 Tax=Alkalilimnicola ehrlichii (strain ATCC BAA-1101 / DSM 17681 / MLHE-1) TaxID=187272 RepID=Q0A658_ALKEH|nr:asparagine synthase (glutamine-hydrolyzing) [Alkalilimnicola ehrlichii]ABI57679.1 asparagine synthase (glutamine-hydrolyzing) [Alkalilimnicola ehrlichii MLHE-1]
MCGITGFWGGPAVDEGIAGRMAARIASRGPDDAGAWRDVKAGVALAHRRLSVIELSPAGHQPMRSPCGRYTLVYNGEIYNHLDLRVALETAGGAPDWRGYSDTETLLAALAHWGVPETLTRLNGMFAFALWDNREATLFLARDRMGEKPLYYGRNGGTFLFGSELKALTAYPGWQGQVDRDALALYLRYNHVPAPRSIYRGIGKLPPAHYVAVRDGGRNVGEPQCYWSLGEIAEQGVMQAGGSAHELADELDGLLRDAVGRRMAADVPLGSFLSGGFDSSMVAAQMQAQSERPVKTFSIGFHEAGYNEADHARAVATHLGTDHTELYITPEEAMAVIPELPAIFDEPFGDSSQIPTYLVSRMAREHVTVSLSGDGGDELFGGYNRHVVGPALWGRLARLPAPLRRGLGRAVGVAARIDRLPGAGRVPQLGEKLDKLASAMRASGGTAFYKDLLSHWKTPATVVRGASEPASLPDRIEAMPNLPGLRERMLYLDMMTYLPDDILTKVDRASMAVSLEARVPLLDHRLVAFAWRVPTDYKVRDGQGKWLFRRVLDRYVPRALMERPKMGFAVPIEHWLRGPLRDWAEVLLDERRLEREGFFHPAPIRRMWAEHLSGRRRHHAPLWNVLMFQAWSERQERIG